MTDDVAVGYVSFLEHLREEQAVVFSLIVSFVVIVPTILSQHPRQRTLAEQNYF